MDIQIRNNELISLEELDLPEVFHGDIAIVGCENLESLKGCPSEIKGNIRIAALPRLRNLKYGPSSVMGNFECEAVPISSLLGMPHDVYGDIIISRTEIRSLDGLPNTIHKGLIIPNNIKLGSLIGCPNEINGDFSCGNCSLETLKGVPTFVHGSFRCDRNSLLELDCMPELVFGSIVVNSNKLTRLTNCRQNDRVHFMCSNNQLTSLDGAPLVSSINCCWNNLNIMELVKYYVRIVEAGIKDFDIDANTLVSQTLNGQPIPTSEFRKYHFDERGYIGADIKRIALDLMGKGWDSANWEMSQQSPQSE